jgi:hypothetical protein
MRLDFMKKILCLIVLVVFNNMAFAAKAPAKASTKEAVPAAPEKRNYTEEEFKKAVLLEAEKLMKKVGSGHLVDFSK